MNWQAIFLTTLAVLIVAYGLAYLFTSPTLAIQSVEIQGVPDATAGLLQADLPGQPVGSNLFRYALANRRAIKKTIGGAEADFASVHVGIHLPHTLVIDIVKRAPVALLEIGDASWALDDRGIAIRQGDDPQISALPLPKLQIEPSENGASTLVLGRPLPPDLSRQVGDGYNLLASLKRQPGLNSLQSIKIDQLRNITLVLNGNLLIKLGQPIEIDSKLALANTLMQQHPDIADSADYIDVSYPARPAMLPKGAVLPKTTVQQVDGSSGATAESRTPIPSSSTL